MQSLPIDLKKNPDIADLVATMQPGDRIDLHTLIKAKDDQTVTLTIEDASEGKDPEDEDAPKGDNLGSADDGEGDADMAPPAAPEGSPPGLMLGEDASQG